RGAQPLYGLAPPLTDWPRPTVPDASQPIRAGRGDAQPISSYDSGPAGETPAQVRLRKNVCYVVLAVFLNEQDEVLLIQEAKKECRGSWYLPAGRMEPRETIVEALQREVKEEAGLQCEPLTLLSVEERGPSWIRFVFLARPTGMAPVDGSGILKTPKEADAESLQAGWYPRTSLPTPLRAHDILHLIELAAQGGIKMAVLRLLQECLTLHHLAVETKGLLGLQHLGKDQTDGICLNVLVTVAFRNPGIQNEPPKVRGENFFWWKVVEEDLQSQLLQRLQESSVVPINR
ncbi:hypothetical protein E2I00_018981, partial [Balaenoptera physalus]